MQQDVVNKFTANLKSSLTRALCFVVECDQDEVMPIHLLWAIGTQRSCAAEDILLKAGIHPEELSALVGDVPVTTKTPKDITPHLSEHAKAIIERAVLTASMYQHRFIGTEHVLSGILHMPDASVQTFFRETELDTSALQTKLTSLFQLTETILSQDTDAFPTANQINEQHTASPLSDTQVLDYFAQEMTSKEAIAAFHPVVGRDREIERIAHILSRKAKNNPILVGEPGVGKTAIVEGLAKRIAERSVPHALLNKRIYQLDLSALIAGTMYRGEFEARIRQLIEEIEMRDDVILFIDEVHTLMGAGATSGSLDAANILKPALARGAIRCIGATTTTEYKKHIEPDGAFERRFGRVLIQAPTREQTHDILLGVKAHYEDHHQVTIDESHFETILTFAERYLAHRQYPDRAIDLLDEACAVAATRHPIPEDTSEERTEIEERLSELAEQKREAALASDMERARSLEAQEQVVRMSLEDLEEPPLERIPVQHDDILHVISHLSQTPITQLKQTNAERLQHIHKALNERIIGQESAIATVIHALWRAHLELQHKQQPRASFLFVGPSGVGKTQLATELASLLHDDDKHLLRLDMSEYSEGHASSKMLGSPAGYVGYRDNTRLTDHLKQFPHSIIVFDEIEKAHRNVQHLLLQILENGVVTDSTGREIDFRHAIIVMTSNIGAQLAHGSALGFDTPEGNQQTQALHDQLREHFSQEFLSRIHHICYFNPLSQQVLQRIIQKEIAEFKARYKKRGIRLHITPGVTKAVLDKVSIRFGARHIRQIIEQAIEHELVKQLMSGSSVKPSFHVKTNRMGSIEVLQK